MLNNINIIKDILEIDPKDIDSINEGSLLEDFNWDSLAMVNFITFISENYDKELEFDSFDEILDFGQLDNLITDIINKK